jgi:beta-phosphoglucomutase-like phosphatase (HAD superfamily)
MAKHLLDDADVHPLLDLRRNASSRCCPQAARGRGSADLIITASRTGRTVTIVSNNSGAAIAAHLDDHRLSGYIKGIVARDDHDPERMKPDPYRVRQAVGILGAENTECTLVGDSLADIMAGHLAGVAVIGYANKPSKIEALTDARGAAVTTDLAEISAALRDTPRAALPN